MPPAYGLHSDPVGLARLTARLPAVCGSVSASDPVDRKTLIAISQNAKLNPLTVIVKQEQASTSTCAAHAGTSLAEAYFWHRTGKMTQLSRLWLYLKAKLLWDAKPGRNQRFVDDGVSIPSIVDVLTSDGVPLETNYPWQPNSSLWPSVDQFLAQQTPALLATAGRNKLLKATPAGPDFDVAVARVLLKDPILWGTGWPFPFGPSGHAHGPIWAEWTGRDFELLVFNSHEGHYVFRCTRQQYQQIIQRNDFGAFHFEGAVDLRFRAETMQVM